MFYSPRNNLQTAELITCSQKGWGGHSHTHGYLFLSRGISNGLGTLSGVLLETSLKEPSDGTFVNIDYQTFSRMAIACRGNLVLQCKRTWFLLLSRSSSQGALCPELHGLHTEDVYCSGVINQINQRGYYKEMHALSINLHNITRYLINNRQFWGLHKKEFSMKAQVMGKYSQSLSPLDAL